MDEKDPPKSLEAPKVPLWKFWTQRRYVVALMAFFGFFNVYALRVNLSIAIVAMTANKTRINEDGVIVHGPEFDWDSKMKGYILSSFFWGYITTQIIGGYISGRIGGKLVFGVGIAVTSLLTIVTPWLAQANVYILLAVRIIEGVFEGVTFPCIHAMWSKWAPPLERSRLATIAFSGSYAGNVVAMPLCAFLADTFGWESIFYFFGTLGIIWFIIWLVVVTDTPEQDRKITMEELTYIQKSMEKVGNKNNSKPLPWKKFLTSLPVWAIIVSHFSENWGFYTLLTQLPTFMKDVLDYDLQKSGFMSALPYLAMAFMMQFSGQFADWFRRKGILTTTQVRKIFNCSGFLAQTVFMMGAAFWMSPTGSTTCLTMAVGLGAFAWAGFSVNHLDIAPQYASVLMGISNTFATIPGILSPVISGWIVQNKSASEWQYVFYISSAVYLFGFIIYGLFASGELQPWAIDEENEAKVEELKSSSDGKENRAFECDSVQSRF